MAPTSVSSRFSTSPVTPSPKSSISLYIASLRPSTLATPSPISRTMPTFCFITEVFTPAIWLSISCSIELIAAYQIAKRGLESGFQLGQPRLDAPVKYIAANFHAQAANELGILDELEDQVVSVAPREIRLDRRLLCVGQQHGALNPRRAAVEVQLHQPLEMRQDGYIASRLRSNDLVHHLAHFGFVQRAGNAASLNQLLRVAAGLFGGFHRVCFAGRVPERLSRQFAVGFLG